MVDTFHGSVVAIGSFTIRSSLVASPSPVTRLTYFAQTRTEDWAGMLDNLVPEP